MLIKRTWHMVRVRVKGGTLWKYLYTGWFLLGVIPIYIDRQTLVMDSTD